MKSQSKTLSFAVVGSSDSVAFDAKNPTKNQRTHKQQRRDYTFNISPKSSNVPSSNDVTRQSMCCNLRIDTSGWGVNFGALFH